MDFDVKPKEEREPICVVNMALCRHFVGSMMALIALIVSANTTPLPNFNNIYDMRMIVEPLF